MPDYPSTFAPGPPNPTHHVLFFAAIPPQRIRDRIAHVWRSLGTSDRLRGQTLHMSLQAIAGSGDPEELPVDLARQAATALRVPPFELCFDRLMTFNGREGGRPIVLTTEGQSDRVNDLAAALHRELTGRGFVLPRWRNVTPHVTLAYGAGFAGARYLTEPIHWTVREFTLVDSLQGQGRHVVLGSWPLIDTC